MDYRPSSSGWRKTSQVAVVVVDVVLTAEYPENSSLMADDDKA